MVRDHNCVLLEVLLNYHKGTTMFNIYTTLRTAQDIIKAKKFKSEIHRVTTKSHSKADKAFFTGKVYKSRKS